MDVNEGHTITVDRDTDRLGGHYGQHFYVERMNGTVVKREHIDTRDRSTAYGIASAAARLYGARLVDRRPDACLYGWSAD